MKIILLGTGTSYGVPVVGCDCEVCQSDHPRNKRTRCSAYISTDNANLLIDTPPDLRAQLLRENISDIDAVLFTHAHADHIFGLDDIRALNKITGKPMRCFGGPDTLGVIRHAFDYAFQDKKFRGGIPQLELVNIAPEPFNIYGTLVTPIAVKHGRFDVYGYRIGDCAYLTDCNFIPEESFERLRGLDLLVLGVLRPGVRTTHFSLEDGLELIEYLKPKQAVLTHTSHRMDYEKISAILPDGVQMGYDGIEFICPDI